MEKSHLIIALLIDFFIPHTGVSSVEMTWQGYIFAPKAHSYSPQRTAELCISHRHATGLVYSIGWGGISQKRLAVFISRAEGAFHSLAMTKQINAAEY